ncbi:hypothetical protein GKZ89_09315 [Bacillus mangrovi]|uniref:Uncharacterized protein n=1 Tax=Metabacillus mangrovi TaxID=1491830 RepID=A0A7X2S6C3_9BACI|nr:hypothetical protein [Metabacillus mangrovi]MTH53601.1 hypothetical protein [Metabacillus mangrovi]
MAEYFGRRDSELRAGSVPLCFKACGDRDLKRETLGAEGIGVAVPEL